MMNRILCIIFSAAICSSSMAVADSYSSGDWVWTTDNPGFYLAATQDTSNHLIGQYCYIESRDCMYLVDLRVTCEIGDVYTALINSDKGAIPVTLVCSHEYEGHNVFVISPFDDIDNVVRNASRMGIVIPLEGDQFKVARFSLRGSANAIDSMREEAESENIRRQKRKNKPDEEYL